MEEATPQLDRKMDLMAMVKQQAARITEVLVEWDEDRNGATDHDEFFKALPVLELRMTREESDRLFGALLAEATTDGSGKIEHWQLFRVLAAGPGVDVDAAEIAAREQLAKVQSLHSNGASSFWARDTDGKAQNRHAIRKHDGALRTWEHQGGSAGDEWQDSLHHEGAFDKIKRRRRSK